MSPNPKRHAFIFITSPSPDPYINALCAIFREYGSNIEITFVGIDGTPVTDIVVRIQTMLRELTEGEYRGKSRDGSEHLASIPRSSVYPDCLTALMNHSQRSIEREDLDAWLHQQITKHPIFDVTALQKDHLVDVVSLLISRGINEIRYFHIHRTPHHDESDLIHALTATDYSYVSVARSRNVTIAFNRLQRQSRTLRIMTVSTICILIIALGLQVFNVGNFFTNAFGLLVGVSSLALQLSDNARR